MSHACKRGAGALDAPAPAAGEGLARILTRPKARRTGPAVPASIAFSRPGSQLPPCCKTTASAWMTPKEGPQHEQTPQTQLPDDVGSTTSSPRSSSSASLSLQLFHTRTQPDAARTPSPDARRACDQQLPAAAAAAATTSDGPAESCATSVLPPPVRKAVRFAPGPLADRAAAGSARGPVTPDGHPAGEGRVAVPVRQLPFSFPTDLNKANLLTLEELLGPENAPSLGRLKRRLAALQRPPRAHLHVHIQQHAQKQAA